jgi:hypothetical protein
MRKNARLAAAIVVFSALSLAIPGSALAGQERGRGQAKKAVKVEKAEKGTKGNRKDARPEVIVVDRDGHVRVIREYARAGSLPPGLAKREQLPPGLRRQLRERGALPPGLQKHLVPVPASFLTRFPHVPPYYQRHFAGEDLLVIDTRTNRIVAIIRDVWR